MVLYKLSLSQAYRCPRVCAQRYTQHQKKTWLFIKNLEVVRMLNLRKVICVLKLQTNSYAFVISRFEAVFDMYDFFSLECVLNVEFYTSEMEKSLRTSRSFFAEIREKK